jgi:uncharacterized protein YwqG
MSLDQLLEEYGLRGRTSELRRHALPAIAFSITEERTTRSSFGGAPLVPSGFEWPSYTPAPRRYLPAVLERLGIAAPPEPVSRELDFLLQIDLRELRQHEVTSELPQSGMLSFFYDCGNQPWGYDPAHQDGFRVVLFEGDNLVARAAPTGQLESRGVKFWRAETLPHVGSRSYEDLVKALDVSGAYCDFLRDFERQTYGREGGFHRLLGHSANIQGDMQLEAQLVSNGLYCGDASGYSDPRAKALEAGASDWVLLLQLDSDDGARIMWGDAGMLYFWIRRQDLAARRFDRTWLTLQCG